MTADLPVDRDEFLRLRTDFMKISKDCSSFVEWLRSSLEETIDCIGAMSGAELEKQSGALQDLRTILRKIETPPEIPFVLADGRN